MKSLNLILLMLSIGLMLYLLQIRINNIILNNSEMIKNDMKNLRQDKTIKKKGKNVKKDKKVKFKEDAYDDVSIDSLDSSDGNKMKEDVENISSDSNTSFLSIE